MARPENCDSRTGRPRPLYAYAIATKRYALINFNQDREPVIRKRLEHGLGNYRLPDPDDSRHATCVDELWADVIHQALGNRSRQRSWHALPAIGRLPLTTPDQLEVFDEHGKAHPEQALRPYNFASVAYLDSFANAGLDRLFAPHIDDPGAAEDAEWYLLYAGRKVRITARETHGELDPDVVRVKSCGDIAGQYGTRPETKFADAYGDRCKRTTVGILHRRRITGGRTSTSARKATFFIVEPRVPESQIRRKPFTATPTTSGGG